MTLADVIVVHFAFGSPFGVYQITRSVRSTRSAAKVAAYFIVWPVFAAAFVRDWLLLFTKADKSGLDAKIARIREKIENGAFRDGLPSSVFEFREVFARYTALTTALRPGEHVHSSRALFEISGRENIAVPSACFGRRNRRRLSFHQRQAQLEFTELIFALAGSHPQGDDIRVLSDELDRVLELAKRPMTDDDVN
jgi:hypothetical protein